MKKKVQIILAITVMFSFLTGCGSKEKMELKAESKDIEYGESISHDPKDYLTNEDEDFLKEVKVETTAENEDNKQYPAIGEYEIILTYKDQIEKVKVSVKDTTAPQFVDIEDQYEVAYNTKLDSCLFKATDLSEVTVTLDDGNVDYKKAGEYQATVTAKDTAGNETKKEMTVVVKAEEKEKTTTSSGNSSSTTKPAASSTAANKPSSSSTAIKPGSTSSSSSGNGATNTNPSESQATTTKPAEEPAPSPTWAMSEAEMTAYAKQCVSDLGFIWSDEATKENSGWFAPIVLRISDSEASMKADIKGSIEATCGLLDPERYGVKGYFEKINEKNYNFYVLY